MENVTLPSLLLPAVKENRSRDDSDTDAVIFQDLVNGDAAPDGLDCHICGNALCQRKSVALVKCGHIFHQSCLERSIYTQNDCTCPICHVQVASSRNIASLVTVLSMEEEEDREEEAHCSSSVLFLDEEEEDETATTQSSRTSNGSFSVLQSSTLDEEEGDDDDDDDDETDSVMSLRTQTWPGAPPPLLIPTPSAERGSITEFLITTPQAESFYDVATAASSLLFSANRRPSDERRRRLDNIAAGGLSVNSINTVDAVVYHDFEKAFQEGDLDKAYVHGWKYCYFCLAYSLTGQHLANVVRVLEYIVTQMDEQARQRCLIESPAERAEKFTLRAIELQDRLVSDLHVLIFSTFCFTATELAHLHTFFLLLFHV
jgi:Ring finger domain